MRLVSYLALTTYAGSLVLTLSGCGLFSFVSDKERQEFKDALDDDGDGVPAGDDCDDENPLRRPSGDPDNPAQPWADSSWVEIPYDGIDNDCDQLDVVDVDGDGYPGIAWETYSQLVMELQGLSSPDDVEWPGNPDKFQVDCVDGADPSQILPDGLTAADVSPAVLDDEPYDGVDRDCGGDNDFDDDGDGQMPAEVNGQAVGPLLQAYIETWGITGIDPNAANAFGDCDDNNDDVYTGASGEIPYDGIDQDCSGDNDFDQDGDGYYPTEYANLFVTFVSNFHPNTAPEGPLEWGPAPGMPAQMGDCLDQPHPNLPAADPSLVHVGAADAYYDGIDSDCLGDNDFDQDGDLYIRTEDVLNLQDYVTNWSGSQAGYPNTVSPLFTADGGDCDDTNPTVAPGNLEILGDGNDADCDANADGTPWSFGGYAWDSPSWPRMVRTNEHYIMGITAAWTSLFDRNHPTLALVFEPTVGYDAAESDVIVWNNISPVNTFVHGAGLDMIADGDSFWVAATYRAPDQAGNPANDRSRMLIRQHTYDTVFGNYAYELANRVFTWQGHDVDLDMQLDETNTLWVTACGGGGRETPYDDPTDPLDPVQPTSFRTMVIDAPVFTNPPQQNVTLLAQTPVSATNGASICFQEIASDGLSALLTICDSDGCESFDADTSVTPGTLAASADTTWANSTFHEADEHSGLILLAEVGGGATIIDNVNTAVYSAFPGEEVLSIDAMWRNGVLFAVAVIEGTDTNTVKLVYGDDPANGFDTTIDLPVYDYDIQYEHTAQNACDPLVPLCTTGRNLDPYKVSLHADQERLALAVAARSLDDPTAPVDILLTPKAQDAVGWVFMGYDALTLP